MYRVNRRFALRRLVELYGAAAVAGLAQDNPLLEPVNVMDFAALAQKKLDPVAWDYLEGGAEDEATLRDNRAGFQKIIIRPKALTGVGKIDTSLGQCAVAFCRIEADQETNGV